MPERFRGLNGKKVLVVGEVAPTTTRRATRSTVYAVLFGGACCYGGPPKVQHFVACKTPGGKLVTNYVGGPPVKVFGTLHINVMSDGDAISSVFQLDVERVEPVS